MDKLPTAEELMDMNNGDDYTHWEEIHALLIAFAKLHVKAALKAAYSNVRTTSLADRFLDTYEADKDAEGNVFVKDSILNAYPENLIQ